MTQVNDVQESFSFTTTNDVIDSPFGVKDPTVLQHGGNIV